MKILVFVRKFNDATHTFIYQELEGLQERGHQVRVLCIERLYPDRFPWENLQVAKFSIFQRVLANRLHRLGIRMRFSNTPLRQSIRQELLEFKPDIIHCHFGPDGLYFVDNYVGNDIPIFIHFHGFDASIMLRDRLYIQRLSDLFQRKDIHPIFVSEFMYNNVVKHTLKPHHKHILYYGTNTRLFEPGSKPKPTVDQKRIFLLQRYSVQPQQLIH